MITKRRSQLQFLRRGRPLRIERVELPVANSGRAVQKLRYWTDLDMMLEEPETYDNQHFAISRGRGKTSPESCCHGQPLDVYASQVLEHAATAPSADEVLEPFRKQVAASGMSDDNLDAFFEDIRDKAYRDRQGQLK